MPNNYKIFIPELVPLENKGEEAIIRGMADVIFPDGNCEIHLLDQVDTYRYQDGIHIYPANWFISPWLTREFGLGITWEKIRDSGCSLARNGLHKFWPSWVKHWCNPLQMTSTQMRKLAEGNFPVNEKERCLQQLLDCNYVIAGHDGALNERVCHIIDLMRELGKDYGIFGVELRTSFRSRAIIDVHYQVLRNSSFFYCRTANSLEVVKKHFPEIDAELTPDPAFGMKPACEEETDSIIKNQGLKDFFKRPVVMCTACETSPISRYCFEESKAPGLKLAAHRKLFAELISYIVKEYNVNVLFLPHAVGPGGALDDRIISRDILEQASLPSTKAKLLELPFSARELKGLLKHSDLLIAERIHSMIGATGVHAPFLCLGSNTDRRIHGIVGEMLGMHKNIYFLNRPSISELKKKFDDVWQRRDMIRKDLALISCHLESQLEKTALQIRKRFQN